jgi:hypothetical protein
MKKDIKVIGNNCEIYKGKYYEMKEKLMEEMNKNEET